MSEANKRVLFLGEASYLDSGYSIYTRRVLEGLHEDFEVCEFSAYGQAWRDPRARDVKWKYETAEPHPDRQDEVNAANSHPMNKFGAWKFEKVCLGFKPHVVCSIRDSWMDNFVARSAYRPFYKWVWLNPVDAEPQQDEWIGLSKNADLVLSYTDYGIETLRSQGSGINVGRSAPGCANFDVFRPMDTGQLRDEMGVDRNAFIVGMVGRNQKRKRFPDLMEGFARYLKKVDTETAERSFLFIHSCWPDSFGWDFPRLIQEFNLTHKCLFTYICHNCGAVFINFFAGARTHCKACGGPAEMPTNAMGVTAETLAKLYGLMDLYIQMASCEGQGIPQVEAAACGVPVFSVDYSGMADVVRKVDGTPILVLAFDREIETNRKFAIPCLETFSDQLKEFVALPSPVRASMGQRAHHAAQQNYKWSETVKVWKEGIDSLSIEDRWNSPPQLPRPSQIPDNLTPLQFVHYGLSNAGRSDLIDTWLASRLVHDLQEGFLMEGGVRHKFGRDEATKFINNLANDRYKWEHERATNQTN